MGLLDLVENKNWFNSGVLTKNVIQMGTHLERHFC